MKANISLLILLLLQTTVFSQAKTCDNQKIEAIDLNTITKCSVEQNQSGNNKRKVSLKIARKRTNHYLKKRKKKVQTRNKVNGIQNIQGSNEIEDIGIEFKKVKINNVKLNEVLFSIVDEIPLFPKCTSNKIKDKTSCFNKEMSNHFAKHFYPERASDEGIKGKVFIQFTIDIKGDVKNLLVRAPKKEKKLNTEVTRVISKLPTFTPGKHKHFPVNVKYSLPINFSVD